MRMIRGRDLPSLMFVSFLLSLWLSPFACTDKPAGKDKVQFKVKSGVLP